MDNTKSSSQVSKREGSESLPDFKIKPKKAKGSLNVIYFDPFTKQRHYTKVSKKKIEASVNSDEDNPFPPEKQTQELPLLREEDCENTQSADSPEPPQSPSILDLDTQPLACTEELTSKKEKVIVVEPSLLILFQIINQFCSYQQAQKLILTNLITSGSLLEDTTIAAQFTSVSVG